ncbi:hypothetical protein COO60DRAFT_1486843, partial [Scenedesmus sp. NREL 46B-D3]
MCLLGHSTVSRSRCHAWRARLGGKYFAGISCCWYSCPVAARSVVLWSLQLISIMLLLCIACTCVVCLVQICCSACGCFNSVEQLRRL